MTMTLIETKTLGTDAAAIEFTSIPADFTDLLMTYSLRNTLTGTPGKGFWFEFNDNSGSVYSFRRLQGNGSAASSYNETNTLLYGYNFMNGASSTSNTFSNGQMYIPNYSGSTNKSISIDNVFENNATEAYQTMYAALFASTSAISKIDLVTDGGNFVTGCTVSLYGITKGSSGGVVVS